MKPNAITGLLAVLGYEERELGRDDVAWAPRYGAGGPVFYEGEVEKIATANGLARALYEKGLLRGAALAREELRRALGLARFPFEAPEIARTREEQEWRELDAALRRVVEIGETGALTHAQRMEALRVLAEWVAASKGR